METQKNIILKKEREKIKRTKKKAIKKAKKEREKAKKAKKRAIKKAKKDVYTNFVKQIKERDNYTCQISGKCFKNAKPQALHVAHILSKENYPELMLNPNNVLCLSFYHHKTSPVSSHLDGFAFTRWLQINKPEQYKFLMDYLEKY